MQAGPAGGGSRAADAAPLGGSSGVVAPGPTRGRWNAVDFVKASAIVAVVFTHAGRVGFGSWGSTADFLLTSVWTRFQVPSFLFVSGLLYARTTGVPAPEIIRRFSRILVPYLVASTVAIAVGLAVASSTPPWMRWPTTVRSAGDLVWQLSTASALGVYYYVLLAVLCLPFVWPLSRTGRGGAWLLLGACLALTLGQDLLALRPLSLSLASGLDGDVVFWATRDPLENFHLGYFAAGWLVALYLDDLARAVAGREALVAGLCGAGVALGGVSFAGLLPFPLGSFDRVLFTFSVVGLLALGTRHRVAGPRVRFLGDATLALYLYHRIFQLLAQPITDGWPALPRIGGQVAAGLLGASLVVWAGRRWLGAERARRLLGA